MQLNQATNPYLKWIIFTEHRRLCVLVVLFDYMNLLFQDIDKIPDFFKILYHFELGEYCHKVLTILFETFYTQPTGHERKFVIFIIINNSIIKQD